MTVRKLREVSLGYKCVVDCLEEGKIEGYVIAALKHCQMDILDNSSFFEKLAQLYY